MPYPWHMTIHPQSTKDLRRAVLDFYGALTVFVSLVLIPGVVCCLGHVYRHNLAADGRRRRFARLVYSANWSLNRPLFHSRPRWGSRKSYLLTALWVLFVVSISIVSTGEDYFHLTKRLSHNAAALLPAQYLLSSRFILQQTSLLSYQTHETLNKSHRLLGRTIYTLLTLHGILYINYFIQFTRYDRFFYWDVFFGFLGLIILNIILITSLPSYRRRAYKFFYSTHQLLSILILPVAWFHVYYTRRYILIAGAIYVVDRVGRHFSTHDIKVKVTHVSSTALDLRGTANWMVADPSTQEQNVKKSRIPAGSHYYIYIPSMARSRGNPFTLSSVDDIDGEIKFLVRVRDGFTRELKEFADNSVSMMVEGPYGIATAFPGFQNFDTFLFVTGGIGVTMTLAVLKELVMQSEEEEVDEKRSVRFVWAVGGVEDASWPLGELVKAGRVVRCRPEVDIYISHSTISEGKGGEEGEGRASMELDELVGNDSQSLLPTVEPPETNNAKEERVDEAAIESLRYRYARMQNIITPRITAGRPDLTRVADEFCNENVGKRIAVFVCGPEGMGVDVRRALERHCGESTIWVWEERFGL